jgi:hypothetical protein
MGGEAGKFEAQAVGLVAQTSEVLAKLGIQWIKH